VHLNRCVVTSARHRDHLISLSLYVLVVVPLSRFRSAKVESKRREYKKKEEKMHFSAFVVAALKIGLDKLSIVARKADAQQLLAPAGSEMEEGECGGFLLISEDGNLKICPILRCPKRE